MSRREEYLADHVSQLRAVLLELVAPGTGHFRKPNSDYYEYCNGCARSPNSVPQHDADCIAERIRQVLKETD